MGRSNKKVKSERINALRKQYDSFLEEDKKRKERNEYILGKLDKMVYSTALVPARLKPTTLIDRPSAMYHLLCEPEAPTSRAVNPSAIIKHQLTPDIPTQTLDDTYLIQEISKNYILIPKLKSPFINKYVPQATPVRNTGIMPDINNMDEIYASKPSNVIPDANESMDWKSKYEILNILNNEENEKQTVKFANERTPETHLNKEILLNNTYDNVAISGNNDTAAVAYLDTGSKYLDDVPEKDIPNEKVNYKLEINDNPITQADPMPHDNTDEVLAASSDAVGNIENKLKNTYLDHTNAPSEVINYADHDEYNYIEPVDLKQAGDHVNYVEHYEQINDIHGMTQEQHYEPVNDLNVLTSDQSPIAEHVKNNENLNLEHVENNENVYVEYVENNQNLYVEQESDLTYKPEVSTEQFAVVDSEKEVYNHSGVNNSNNYVQQNSNDPTVSNANATDYAEYETENIRGEELRPTDYQMKSSTDLRPEDTVEKTGVNVIDPSLDITNDLEIPPDAVPEVNESAIIEESVDMAGIQDFEDEQREMFYSEDPNTQYGYNEGDVHGQDYEQHEAYQQNKDYYESTLPQTYPVDVGEDEEQTLMYDPSYQQQYENSIEKAYRQEQPQDYEKSEVYEEMQPQEGLSMYHPIHPIHQQSYENVEQVQSMLDNEEGYTEKAPDVAFAQPDAK